MTHWRKASPQIPSPKVAVVCGENRGQGRDLPMRPCLHGRKWRSAMSVGRVRLQPLSTPGQGADSWCSVFPTDWFSPLGHLASLPEDPGC